jgi:hypothetical protein
MLIGSMSRSSGRQESFRRLLRCGGRPGLRGASGCRVGASSGAWAGASADERAAVRRAVAPVRAFGAGEDAPSALRTRSAATPASLRILAIGPRGSCSAASSTCSGPITAPASRASLDATSSSRLAWEVYASASPPRVRPRRPPASSRSRTRAGSRPRRERSGSPGPPGCSSASRMCSAPTASWPSRWAWDRASSSVRWTAGLNALGLRRGLGSEVRAAWLRR